MQEKIPDLKQFRKESNRHVLVLEAQVSEQDTNDASINKAGNLNNGDMVQRRIPLWEN